MKNATHPVDRRGFLAAVGLAATGAAASAVTLPGTPRPRSIRRDRESHPSESPNRASSVRLALKYGMIQQGDSIADRLKIAREAGFEGVEFDAPSDLPNEEIRRAGEDARIEIIGVVCSTHWSKPLSHPDERVRLEGRHGLEQAIMTAHELGTNQVLLVPAVVNADTSYAEAYERSRLEISRVFPIAKELGVSIALENVWNNFLLSPIETSQFIDDVVPAALNRFVETSMGWKKMLGVYFDVGNIWAYGWPSHWLEVLGPHCVNRLDIKGYSRAKADKEGKWAGFGVEIGDGDVPWESVRDWIAETKWSGWATAEVRGGDEKRLSDIASRMTRVLGL